MAVTVSAFTAQARAEFGRAKLEYEKVMPPTFDSFTSRLNSDSGIEVYSFLNAMPRLREWLGENTSSRMSTKKYEIPNKTYRIGPVEVSKDSLDDEKLDLIYDAIRGLPTLAQNDSGLIAMRHLANGGNTPCWDGSNFFANSHNIGVGDNIITIDCASNDSLSYKVIGLIHKPGQSIRPLLIQDREPLSGLLDDTQDSKATKARRYEYWADCRFGLGFGYWWDAVRMDVTDTPSLAECKQIIRDICDQFRTFKLPANKTADEDIYVHADNWVPDSANFTLVVSPGLMELFNEIRSSENVNTGSGNTSESNVYRNRFNLVASSALA
jgi:phage major head subunit gpT-like protein